MKTIGLVLATAALVSAGPLGDAAPLTLPRELFSDVNKGPHAAVNVFMESSDDQEQKQIQISQQLAALYGASAVQEFGARQGFRNRHSFLQGSPGAASVGGATVGGATVGGATVGGATVGGAAGDAAMVSSLSALLDQVAAQASGSQSTGTVAGGSGNAPALTQEMMANQEKAKADFKKAAMMNQEAADVWAGQGEKNFQSELRAAMESSSPKASTLGKVRASIFGGSHATSFLSPQSAIASAKISPAALQKIGSDVMAAVDSSYTTPRFGKCPACNKVNYGACPDDFTEDASGVCTPTSSYNGFCNRAFLNLGSQLEKMEYEFLCETCYPCSA